MARWNLFIDESGKFKDPDQRCLVLGLLVQEEDASAFSEIAKSELVKAYPRVPYPPHATDLNVPAGVLAAWTLTHDRNPDPDSPASVMDALASFALESANDALRPYQDAISRGRMPKRGALDLADAFIERNAGSDCSSLRAYADRLQRRRMRLLEALGQAYGRERCFLIGAAETTVPQDSWEGDPTDRYLRLLSVLIERVLSLFRELPRSAAMIDAYIATRDRMDGSGPLSASDIHHAVSSARRLYFLCPATSADDVTVELKALQRYDATVSPGIVLADAISNCLLPFVGSATWPNLSRAARRRTALSPDGRCQSNGQWLPSIASTGSSRTALLGSVTDLRSLSPSGDEPGWAWDQASRWLSALRSQAPGSAAT